MKISHNTRVKNINPRNGYGYATDRMIDSLTRLGHEITKNDPTAPVGMWFDQPQHWEWPDNQYKIGYLPWESTQLLEDWPEYINECDELWTPSPIIASWFPDMGVKIPIYVYEHGVDKIWTPKKRKIDDGQMKFLHSGFEAARKGSDMIMQAFRDAFAHKNDVTLTLKMINPGLGFEKRGKINFLNKSMPVEDLVELYHDHHVYVYPSYGEGFGLTPLQAMATGMPTITVPDWAPYSNFLDPNLNIPAQLKTSKWQSIHPGKMFRPNRDDLVDRMRYAYDNYDEVHDFAHSQVPEIKAKYDWDSLTNEAFSSLKKRIE